MMLCNISSKAKDSNNIHDLKRHILQTFCSITLVVIDQMQQEFIYPLVHRQAVVNVQ